MNGTAARFLRLGVSLSGLLVLGWVLIGQAARPQSGGPPHRLDPSACHLFPACDLRTGQPGYPRSALLAAVLPADGDARPLRPRARATMPSMNLGLREPRRSSHRDWSEDLGIGASSGAGNYPAKFAFQITTANCGSAATPDYVVFSTGSWDRNRRPAWSLTTISILDAADRSRPSIGPSTPAVRFRRLRRSPADGKQVAFVETNGGFGILVLLKWAGWQRARWRSRRLPLPFPTLPIAPAPHRA